MVSKNIWWPSNFVDGRIHCLSCIPLLSRQVFKISSSLRAGYSIIFDEFDLMLKNFTILHKRIYTKSVYVLQSKNTLKWLDGVVFSPIRVSNIMKPLINIYYTLYIYIYSIITEVIFSMLTLNLRSDNCIDELVELFVAFRRGGRIARSIS